MANNPTPLNQKDFHQSNQNNHNIYSSSSKNQYTQPIKNNIVTNNQNMLSVPSNELKTPHSRQLSDSGYSFLDYYTTSPDKINTKLTSSSPPSRDLNIGHGHHSRNGLNNAADETVDGFTIIPNLSDKDTVSNSIDYNNYNGNSNVTQRRQEKALLSIQNGKQVPTITESKISLQNSRNSSEKLRNKIGRSISSGMDMNKTNTRITSTSSSIKTNSNNEAGPKTSHRRGNSTTSILQSDRDIYGFKKQNNYISRQEYDTWWVDYSKYLIRRKKKWEKFMNKNGLQTSSSLPPTRFPPRSQELMKFIRKGIPAEWRGNAWFYFAKGHDKLRDNKGVYDELLNKTMNTQNINTEAIEKDLHRTFPENIHFANINTVDPVTGETKIEESPLVKTLRRVLRCFAEYKPYIGYCQSMNFITGLLLIFMEEEKAFWMLVIITEKFFPGVHDLTLEGLTVHQGVLLLCIREYLPDIWDIICPSNEMFLYDLPPVSLSTTHWFMSIFVGVLPIETTLRVWDCLFYEDSKSIFQVSLTIFDLLTPQIFNIMTTNNINFERNKKKKKISSLSRLDLNNNDDDDEEIHEFLSAELFQIVQNGPKKMIDVNKLLEDCFKYSSFQKLSQDEIIRHKKHVIETRERYNELIQKRSKNISEDNRKRILKEIEIELGTQMMRPNGLKTRAWSGKLNTKLRDIQRKLR